MIRVLVLPRTVAIELWNTYKPYLLTAVNEHPAETVESLEEIRTDIRKGRALVLQIYEGVELQAVAVVELLDLKDGKSLHVRYLGGNGMDGWLDELSERLDETARFYDCDWVSIIGRLGWARSLKKYDYKPVSMELRKAVKNG